MKTECRVGNIIVKKIWNLFSLQWASRPTVYLRMGTKSTKKSTEGKHLRRCR